MITTLSNSGAINGGAGGAVSGIALPGSGGAGLSNAGGGTLETLSNSGAIAGAWGGTPGGADGAGILNAGTIGSLNNSGTITSPNYAIYSTGSIGPIINSGLIVGNVEIDNQASVTTTGGLRAVGSWSRGTITVGSGDLTFAGGDTALGDNIVVNGGAGTVFNHGPLLIAASQTISGNYNQSSAGGLDFVLEGIGEYGTLAVTGEATLGGTLGIYVQDFTLATGNSFDLLSFGSLAGDFVGLSLDGVSCSARASNVWSCGGLTLEEAIGTNSLDLNVLGLSLVHEPSIRALIAASAVPEPSTLALIATGFLGLGGLGLRERTKPRGREAEGTMASRVCSSSDAGWRLRPALAEFTTGAGCSGSLDGAPAPSQGGSANESTGQRRSCSRPANPKLAFGAGRNASRMKVSRGSCGKRSCRPALRNSAPRSGADPRALKKLPCAPEAHLEELPDTTPVEAVLESSVKNPGSPEF
jgi:hypothetical protein